jgi:hypothetical protein
VNIKKWYLETFPDDEMGENINDDADFTEMDYYEVRHIYDYLGDIDTVIRERVFQKLASLLNMEYKEVYDIWLS